MPAFSLSRETTIQASPDQVHALINDFRNWAQWSPWEARDPELKRTFSGAESGLGAKYAWEGNKQVGSGTMEITSSQPDRIEIELCFLVPFKATNQTTFELTPAGEGTRVVWSMTGQRNVLMAAMGKLFFNKAIAKDYDQGLAKLAAAAETT